MEEGLNYRTEGIFNGQEYNILVKSANEQLTIQLESKYDLFSWSGSFNAGYLEELTQKTGQRQRYGEFVQAIVAGLAQRTDGCNVEILTFQDLENMRNNAVNPSSANSNNSQQNGLNSGRKGSSSSMNSNNSNTNGNQKRYLIITSEIEIKGKRERLHYPLSLNLEDPDNPEILKTQIRRIKLELDELKGKSTTKMSDIDPQSSKGSFSSSKQHQESQGMGFFLTAEAAAANGGVSLSGERRSTQNSMNNTTQSIAEQLKSENETLKQKIKLIEESASQKKGAVELDTIVRNKFELEEALEITKRESQMKIDKLKQQIRERENDLNKTKSQFQLFQKEIVLNSISGNSSNQMENASDMNNSLKSEESVRRLREQVSRLSYESEQEVEKQRRSIQQQGKELERSAQEIEAMKNNDRKQKNRIKQLEIELEQAIKKVSTKSTTDRLYSPYHRNSPNSSSSKTSIPDRRSTSVPTKSYSPAARLNNNNNVNNRQGNNNSNTGNSYSRLSPSYNNNTRLAGQGQQTNNNARLSPASRFTQNNNMNKAPGFTNSTANSRLSPSTKVTNYLSAHDLNLNNRRPGSNNNNSNNNSGKQQTGSYGQYSSSNSQSGNKMQEIDSRINKLQSLLNMAKK